MTARQAAKLAGFIIDLDRDAHCAAARPLTNAASDDWVVDLHLTQSPRHAYVRQYSQRAALDAVSTVWADYAEDLVRTGI